MTRLPSTTGRKHPCRAPFAIAVAQRGQPVGDDASSMTTGVRDRSACPP